MSTKIKRNTDKTLAYQQQATHIRQFVVIVMRQMHFSVVSYISLIHNSYDS